MAAVELGWRLFHSGRADQAETMFRMAFGQAIAIDDPECGLHATGGLVKALLQTGKAAEAERLVGQLQTAAPDAVYLDTLMAQVRMHDQRFAEAAELLESVLAKAETPHSMILTDLAVCRSRTGDLGKAEALARQAVAIDARSAAAMFTLVQVLLASEQFDEAERVRPALQALMPNSPQIASLGKQIAELKEKKVDGGGIPGDEGTPT